jgi:hypothetical protein
LARRPTHRAAVRSARRRLLRGEPHEVVRQRRVQRSTGQITTLTHHVVLD